MGGSGTESVVDAHFQTRCLEHLLHHRQHPGTAHALVRDDEGLGASQLAGLVAEMVERPDAGDERLRLAMDTDLPLDRPVLLCAVSLGHRFSPFW